MLKRIRENWLFKSLDRTLSLFFILIGMSFIGLFWVSLWINSSLTMMKMKDLVWIPVGIWYEKVSISIFESEFSKYWFNKKMVNIMKEDKTLRIVANEIDDNVASWHYNPWFNTISLFWVKDWKIDDVETLLHESVHYMFFHNDELLETYRKEVLEFKNKYNDILMDENFEYDRLELYKSWNLNKVSEYNVISTIDVLHSQYSPKWREYSIENIDNWNMWFAQEVVTFNIINGKEDICRVFPKTANILYNNCSELIEKGEKRGK